MRIYPVIGEKNKKENFKVCFQMKNLRTGSVF